MSDSQSKKTCFSCAEVFPIEGRHDKCFCMFEKLDEDDAELIYEPTTGECPAWHPAIESKEEENEPES